MVQILPSHTGNQDDNDTNGISRALIPLFFKVLKNKDVSTRNLEENMTLILNDLCVASAGSGIAYVLLRPPKSSEGSWEGFSTNAKTTMCPRPT